MGKFFTREQALALVREGGIRDGKSLEDAFVESFREVLQEILEAELEHELGYSKYDWKNKNIDNSRNGHSKKTVSSQFGEVTVSVPRDARGEFEPVVVKKHERKLSDRIDDMVIGMYAKGMSTRDIHSHVQGVYGVEVSAEMVSQITDKVLPLAREWQNRPLNPLYPVLYLDGMVFNVLQDGQVTKKTAYLIFGINIDGRKEVLGIWIGENESSKFWMKVLVDLKNRGVKDILIACVDGLSGFEEAIQAVYPQTEIQRCIVHQVRYSTRFVSYKDRKQFCSDMRTIYTMPNEEAGLQALDRFEQAWGKKYPYAIKSWHANWQHLSTFYKYPEEVRRIMYTTNPIESFNRIIRKISRNKSSFPTDDSLLKLLYLVVADSTEKWTVTAHNWSSVISQLCMYFGERLTKHLYPKEVLQ